MKNRQQKLRVTRRSIALLVPIMLAMMFALVVLVEENLFKHEVSEIPVSEADAIFSQTLDYDILEVRYLDVGQGESILIRLKNGFDIYTMLIDTGERKYADGLKQYLLDLETDGIDVLVNTHPHADHMGAMAELINTFDIGEIYMPQVLEEQIPTTKAYENLLDAMIDKGLKANVLYEGAYIDMPGEAQIEVYWPKQKPQYDPELNNVSGVFRLSYGETSFLFTGDAEEVVEEALLNEGVNLSATVLSCGHHGSSTSTSWEFLEAVNPRISVISCGIDNRYGHPHEETLKALQRLECEIYRTDEDSTIIMQSDGTQITVATGNVSIGED